MREEGGGIAGSMPSYSLVQKKLAFIPEGFPPLAGGREAHPRASCQQIASTPTGNAVKHFRQRSEVRVF